MIRAKKLHEVLAGRLGGGVRAAMVFNHDGALLGAAASPSEGDGVEEGGAGAVAGGEEGDHEAVPSKESVQEAQVMAAITSHIWSTYAGVGLDGQPLETLVFELEGARIVALPAGPHHLVCLVGTNSAEVGLLLTKAQALGSYLREAFRQVAVL